jgi:hypothetical protein
LQNDAYGSWQARRDLIARFFDPVQDELDRQEEAEFHTVLTEAVPLVPRPVGPRWTRRSLNLSAASAPRHCQTGQQSLEPLREGGSRRHRDHFLVSSEILVLSVLDVGAQPEGGLGDHVPGLARRQPRALRQRARSRSRLGAASARAAIPTVRTLMTFISKRPPFASCA